MNYVTCAVLSLQAAVVLSCFFCSRLFDGLTASFFWILEGVHGGVQDTAFDGVQHVWVGVGVGAGAGGPPDAAHAQVCALPQPRRHLVPQGPQEAVPLEGMPLRSLRPGGGAAARHGGAGGTAQVSSSSPHSRVGLG